MSGYSNTFFSKIVGYIFPRFPDFYGLLNDQVLLLAEMAGYFTELMDTNNPDMALKIRAMEHQGDSLKARNLQILASSFATPMDREDIYRAIISIDAVMNYLKTMVREMELLAVLPDENMRQMAQLIREGIEALKRGYSKLYADPALGEEDSQAVAKAERTVEKVYRRALVTLLDTDENIKNMVTGDDMERAIMDQVMKTLRRREVYRHLSNTADQVANAGNVLHDIVVQIS